MGEIMKIFKIILLSIICVFSIFTACDFGSENNENLIQNNGYISVSERKSIPQNEAFDFVSDMQIGWNLGNSLDAHNNGFSSETAWGNPEINKTLLEEVAKAGFEVVRIPITWLGHVGKAPNYTIEESFLTRVSEVVDYAKSAGLKIIINIHHDGADSVHWLNIKDAAKDISKNLDVQNQLSSMWKQIAQKFLDSEEYLIFEPMNEIHDGYWGWGANRNDNGAQYDILNEWNQVCVDAIRSVGAKNYISIPGYVTNPDLTMQHLKLPNDSLNKLLVTVHFYDPYDFAIGATLNKWGTRDGKSKSSDEIHIDTVFSDLYSKYVSEGIPVLISECGAVYQKGYEKYRRYYVEYMVKLAHINGLIPILWDNGASGSGKECFGLFNRASGEVYSHAQAVVDVAIKASKTEYTEIKLP